MDFSLKKSNMNNEIKKMLYKQKPLANVMIYTVGATIYSTELEDGTTVQFKIPTEELTDYHEDTMPSQLLIRWISSINRDVSTYYNVK
jgi:hypothetical protein